MRADCLALAALAALASPSLANAGIAGSLSDAMMGPKLSPVPATTLSVEKAPETQPASANSLWHSGSRAFFVDQRASRVGDILTVLISIDDSAKTSDTTATGQTTSNQMGIPHFFGLEGLFTHFMPKAFDPTNLISTNNANSTAGNGAINRSEQISLTVAAVVTEVLPNGNLVIQGDQEVKTNAEVRQLTVSGIVRPEDITSANTINHTQIAEARIAYGGKGDLSAVQKTPGGTALLQRFWPF